MADISLLFGVDGGGSISGKSGALIKGQIDSIVSAINRTPIKIKFQADENSLKALTNSIRSACTDSVKNLDISASAMGSGNMRARRSRSTGTQYVSEASAVNLQRQLKDLAGTEVFRKNQTLIELYISVLDNAKQVARRDYEEMAADLARFRDELTHGTDYQATAAAKQQEAATAAAEAAVAAAERQANAQTRLETSVINLRTRFEQLRMSQSSIYTNNKAEIDAIIASLQNEGNVTAEMFAKAQNALARFTEQARTGAGAEMQSINQQIKQMMIMMEKLNAFKVNNPRAYSAYSTDVDALEAALKAGIAGNATYSAEQLAAFNEQLTRFTYNANQSNLAGRTFFDTIRSGWKKFKDWSIVSKTFMWLLNTFKKMIKAVRELDKAMTELKKVTDLSAAEYTRFFQKAEGISRSVGARLADTINATADFARLGYSVSESAELAKSALVYKNVGDGIDSVSDATESLISTMKAFGYQASDSMQIVDMFNEVGRFCPAA